MSYGRRGVIGESGDNDGATMAIIKFVKCRASLIFDAVQYRDNGRGDCHGGN